MRCDPVAVLRSLTELQRFCASCAAPPRGGERVCRRCGLGIVLSAAQAPAPGEPFAVVDRDGRVRALSVAAGDEAAALGRPLPDVLGGRRVVSRAPCGPPPATLVRFE